MKRFLIPLLAALTLPTAVNAQTWYLLAKNSAGTWTVPMPNENQCNTEGKRFNNNKNQNDWTGYNSNLPGYICVLGK